MTKVNAFSVVSDTKRIKMKIFQKNDEKDLEVEKLSVYLQPV